MTYEPFLKPEFCGERFNGHQVPLEVLADLAALEHLISDAARERYLKDHPDRERVPRGFKSIELRLEAVEEASAIPVIRLAGGLVAQGSFTGGVQQYYEGGRDDVIAAIKAAGTDGSPTDNLSPSLLNHFQKFGRSLREGEEIRFSSDAEASGVIGLTPQTRRKLVSASSRPTTLSEETWTRGTIQEFDKISMSCLLQLLDGRQIEMPVPAHHYETISIAFAGDHTIGPEPKVWVAGIGLVDQTTNLLQKMESLEDVVQLDPLDIPARIEEIESLSDGWLTGDHGLTLGTAYDAKQMAWFEETFESHYPDDMPLPRLYPSPEGLLVLEWQENEMDVSFDVDLTNQCGHLHTVNLSRDEEAQEHDFDLREDNGWQDWVGVLRQQIGALA